MLCCGAATKIIVRRSTTGVDARAGGGTIAVVELGEPTVAMTGGDAGESNLKSVGTMTTTQVGSQQQ